MYTDAEGELAVRIARDVIDAHTRGRGPAPLSLPTSFDRASGAFATINTYPEDELRGCMGYASPMFPLSQSIAKAAAAATEDPRFPKLREEELDRVVVEVSVLTPPEEISAKRPKDFAGHVRLGVDGLIVAQGPHRGLLLPQVAVAQGWDGEEFLAQTCMKAGLLPDAWLEPDIRIYRFQSEIWTETKPRGPVVRRMLTAHARA